MKALLFDLDGVLVDVSASYREAIRMTVKHFSGTDISGAGIQSFKDRGGLNNDWDLTSAFLAERGIETRREDIIAVFQKFYLGDDHNGLIRNESWLLRRPVLESLARNFSIGIVTGRPAPETEYTLGHFGVRGLFPAVVTMDDIPPDRGKPDPFGILTALGRLGLSEGYYAGDTGDDILAAQGAGLVPIGVVQMGSEREREARKARLLEAGAVCVINDINEIKEALS
jgi:HAD superfamily phosphatase